MLMKDLSKLEVFSYTLLQDALNLMRLMDREGITKEDLRNHVNRLKVEMVREGLSPERKAQIVEDMKKKGWELKKPCGGCKKKKEEV